MSTEIYLHIEGYFESVKDAERQEAIKNGQVFICNMKRLDYKTLHFGVFDPSIKDTVKLIAVFREKDHAITFINAQY